MSLLDDFYWRYEADSEALHDEKVDALIDQIRNAWSNKEIQACVLNFDEELRSSDIDKIYRKTGVKITL